MNIRMIGLAVFFCIAVVGTCASASAVAEGATFVFTAATDEPILHNADSCLYVKLYRAEHWQNDVITYRVVQSGHWAINGLQVNGVDLYAKILSAVKDVYNYPGPSGFLEALMEELRVMGCDGPRFTYNRCDNHLDAGIQHLKRGLIWQTQFISFTKRLDFFNGRYGFKESGDVLDETLLYAAVEISDAQDFTIVGYEKPGWV